MAGVTPPPQHVRLEGCELCIQRERVEEKTEVDRLHNTRRPGCQKVLHVETSLDQDEESQA